MIRSPEQWRRILERSSTLQKERKDEAMRFLRAYTGDYSIKPKKDVLDGDKDEMIVNFIFAYVETIAPTVFSGTPRAFVEAMNRESEVSLLHYQAVINHFVRTLGLRRELNKCNFDRFFGHAAFLTEWDYQEEEQEEEQVAYIDPSTGIPVPGKPQSKLVVLRDRPLAKRLDPWKVKLDPDADSREEDRWRSYEMIMGYEEFLKLPGVGGKLKSQVEPQEIPRGTSLQTENRDNEGSEKAWVVVEKIYDLANERVLYLPQGQNVKDFADAQPWPWLFDVEGDRFPITILEAHRDASNPYSFSPFRAFWSQIMERSKLRTLLQSHTRRNAPGWLGLEGVMDDEEAQKFVDAGIGELVRVKNLNGVIPRPNAILAKEFFAHNQVTDSDLMNISGLNEYNATDAQTATEASLQEGRLSIRKNFRKSQFQDFQATIFGKIGQLCQQYLDSAVSVRIKAPHDPRELLWMDADRHKIQGEFFHSVKAGVDEYENEGLFRQQTLKYAEVMAKNPHTDQRRLAEDLAKTFRREPDEALLPLNEVKRMEQAQMEAMKGEQKPPLQFSDIKWELLPPEVQAAVLQAAMAQNEVSPPPEVSLDQPAPSSDGAGSGAPPSLAPPGAGMDSVMPSAGINQAPPPKPFASEPPSNPVMPMSEMQGGPNP